jgi:hypothetical protein
LKDPHSVLRPSARKQSTPDSTDTLLPTTSSGEILDRY